jgi:hypothetical protein
LELTIGIFTNFNTNKPIDNQMGDPVALIYWCNIPVIRKGEKELFADGAMIARLSGIRRKIHAADKLDKPVLEADMPCFFPKVVFTINPY